MCKESLDSIVAGDKVVLSTMNKMTVLIVSRTTKTKIICGNKRFARKDGLPTPRYSWCCEHIVPWTPELQKEIDEAYKRSQLRKEFVECLDYFDELLSMLLNRLYLYSKNIRRSDCKSQYIWSGYVYWDFFMQFMNLVHKRTHNNKNTYINCYRILIIVT